MFWDGLYPVIFACHMVVIDCTLTPKLQEKFVDQILTFTRYLLLVYEVFYLLFFGMGNKSLRKGKILSGIFDIYELNSLWIMIVIRIEDGAAL
ncbi:hypothetical protein CRI66_00115 [Escherichia sp. E4694]|uniref:hypothetical protein n=1 Tax=Escherichia sp. E4694 TaxID=2044464 RepID=UPI001080DCCB|nr:hypothetical protein [Escherichia sp. E4694]TGB80900.1 hypothetical protein CRI66_00115 [Escherichia sp. E4694]